MTEREKIFFYHGVLAGSMGPLGQDRHQYPVRLLPLLLHVIANHDKPTRGTIQKEIEETIIALEAEK